MFHGLVYFSDEPFVTKGVFKSSKTTQEFDVFSRATGIIEGKLIEEAQTPEKINQNGTTNQPKCFKSRATE